MSHPKRERHSGTPRRRRRTTIRWESYPKAIDPVSRSRNRFRPLEFTDAWRRWTGRWRSRWRSRRGRLNPNISVRSGVRTAGSQRLEGIKHEWQRLEINADLFDGFGGGQFVHRSHGKDRLPPIKTP